MISVDVKFTEFFIYVDYSLLLNINHIDWFVRSEIGQKEQLSKSFCISNSTITSLSFFCHKVT